MVYEFSAVYPVCPKVGEPMEIEMAGVQIEEHELSNGLAEVSTVAFVDSLNETILIGMIDESSTKGLENIKSEGSDQIDSFAYLDFLDASELDEIQNGTSKGVNGSSCEDNISYKFQTSRWASVSDLNKTVFEDEATEMLNGDHFTYDRENESDISISTFRSQSGSVELDEDSHSLLASRLDLDLKLPIHGMLEFDGGNQSGRDVTFTKPGDSRSGSRHTNNSDEEENESTLTLGEEGKQTYLGFDNSYSYADAEEAEMSSGDAGNTLDKPYSCSSSEIGSLSPSSSEPPRTAGKILQATPSDLEKAKILISNFLLQSDGWNKYRLEFEDAIQTDNLNTLNILKNSFNAYKKVSMLYGEAMEDEELLTGHMLGFIKKFTKPSTSLYLEGYNRTIAEFQKRINDFKHVRNIIQKNIRDPRLPVPKEFVNVPDDEVQRWITSFQNKLFSIRDLLEPNDTYSYENLEFVMSHMGIPQGKIAGTVTFENLKYLCSVKTLWQHNDLINKLKEEREAFEHWIREVPKPEETDELSVFGNHYRLEFRIAKIDFLNNACDPYLEGFGMGVYDETTDFEEIVTSSECSQ